MSIRAFSVELAKETNLTQLEAFRISKAFVSLIKKKVLKGEIVCLTGFASFQVDIQQEKNIYNIAKRRHEIKAKCFKMKYRFSKKLLEKIREKKVY